MILPVLESVPGRDRQTHDRHQDRQHYNGSYALYRKNRKTSNAIGHIIAKGVRLKKLQKLRITVKALRRM